LVTRRSSTASPAQFRALDDVDVTVVARPGWADALRAAGHSAVESEDVAGDLAVIGAAVSATEGSVVLAAADLVAHGSAIASIAGLGYARQSRPYRRLGT